MERIPLTLLVSNLGLGGAERQVVQIANGLDRDQFVVSVLALSEDNPLASDLADDVHFEVLPHASSFGADSLVALRRRLAELGTQVVHGFLFEAEFLSRVASLGRAQLRVIGSIRNSNYEINRKRFWLKRLTDFRMDLCVSNSQAGIDYHQAHYHLPDDRYRVVRNGVNTTRFQPRCATDNEHTLHELGLDPERPVIGVFASFKRQKNHLTLLEAAELLELQRPGVQYAFVGGELEPGQRNTDAYARQLMQAVEESPIRSQFHFLGKRKDVERLYPACTLTALPSWHEGLPNVLLESAVCGVPCIATDVSDNALLIEEYGLGCSVPAGDAQAMADALEVALRDGLTIRAEHLARVREDFSNATMIRNMSSVYLSVLRDDLRAA